MDLSRRKIVRARAGLLLEHPFFGSLCLRMVPREDRRCATAWTDGRTLAYNPGYVAGLSDDQVAGLMAHTVMHPACQHHTRRNGRDSALWNIACDHAINWILLDAGIELPPKYLDNPAYHGLTADEIYARIRSDGGEEARPSLSDKEGEADGEVDWDDATGEPGQGDDLGDDAGTGAGDAGGDGLVEDGVAGDDPADVGSEQFGDPGGSGEVRDGGATDRRRGRPTNQAPTRRGSWPWPRPRRTPGRSATCPAAWSGSSARSSIRCWTGGSSCRAISTTAPATTTAGRRPTNDFCTWT